MKDWIDPVSLEERERLRSHPGGKPLMRQTWRRLLFLHFPVDPDELAHVVPEGLTLDLYPDERGIPVAWIGVVPFSTENIRPLGLPPLPGLAGFDEINVRTYVHHEGKDPSVLFLSLDGGPLPIRALARAYYKVPYFKAETRLTEREGSFTFTSSRHRPDGLGTSDITYRPIEELPLLSPGSIDYFLLERYQILAGARGKLYRSRIYHAPYRAWSAEFTRADTNLPETHGIPTRPFIHTLYSDQVNTQFFGVDRIR